MFTQVCEEAATLILLEEHLVDFIDLNVYEVALSHYTERAPVVIVLKNASDRERGICKDAWGDAMMYISGAGMLRCTRVYVWLILAVRCV